MEIKLDARNTDHFDDGQSMEWIRDNLPSDVYDILQKIEEKYERPGSRCFHSVIVNPDMVSTLIEMITVRGELVMYSGGNAELVNMSCKENMSSADKEIYDMEIKGLEEARKQFSETAGKFFEIYEKHSKEIEKSFEKEVKGYGK